MSGSALSFADLKGDVGGRPPKVAVGPLEGGASETWSHLTTIEPGLSGVAVEASSGCLALNHLEGGALDAVVWVTDPGNFEHNMLLGVRAQESLELMGV